MAKSRNKRKKNNKDIVKKIVPSKKMGVINLIILLSLVVGLSLWGISKVSSN